MTVKPKQKAASVPDTPPKVATSLETNRILPVTYNKENKFTVVRLHYSADPTKDDEWVKVARQGMPERGWLREYEIDYTVYEGKSFYPEFREYNIQLNEYQPRETLYRGWDYGYHRPCVLITRINQFDQWAWLECILGEDEGILDFGVRIDRYCKANYPGAYFVDAGDPAGEQMSDKSEKTSVEILASLGIYVRSRRMPIKHGAEIIRNKLAMRNDGKVGLTVNPNMHNVIDGFKGGLHYPEVKEGQPQKEFYAKDGYYDHIFDAGRYIATELFSVAGEKNMRNQLTESDSEKERWRMGRPEDPNENELTNLSNQLFSDNTNLGDWF